MKRVLALLLLTTPALADEQIVIEFQNKASQSAEIMGIFPVNEAGEFVDDNVGTAEAFGPGETVTIVTALIRCMKVDVGARFADGEEVWGRTDLCKNRTLILHD